MKRTSRDTALIHQRLLDFIVKFKTENGGNSPTVREITDGLGISTTSITQYHLVRMAKNGLIYYTGPFKNRKISVPGYVYIKWEDVCSSMQTA